MKAIPQHQLFYAFGMYGLWGGCPGVRLLRHDDHPSSKGRMPVAIQGIHPKVQTSEKDKKLFRCGTP